jgi:hypothetical protein
MSDEAESPRTVPPDPVHTRVTRSLQARRRPFLYRVFAENPWFKVLSIAIAVGLFFVVREDKGKEVDIEVPVALANLPDNHVFIGEIPRALRVRVRDRWSRLARALEQRANPYSVDLRGFPDDTTYVFDRDRLAQLLGVTVLSIQSVYPSDFVVHLDDKVERTVPIKPIFVGTVPDGYDLPKEHIQITPREIKISGARNSVRQVEELATYPVELGSLEKDARIEVQIQKPTLPFLTFETEKVRIEMQVRPRYGKMEMGKVAVAIRDCPEGLECRMEPRQVGVTLSGPMPALLKLKKQGMANQVYVNAPDYDADVMRHDGVRPSCERPSGVECAFQPRSVTFFTVNPEQEKNPQWHKPGHQARP